MPGALVNNQGTENMLKQYDHHLSGGATIYPEHMSLIENVLSDLVLNVPVLFALLTDTAGQNISWDGAIGETNLVFLGALIASDLAASMEIARVTGEYQNHNMILHEGKTSHTFISGAGPHLVLFVKVLSEIPLGWSRKYIREAVSKMEEIIGEGKAKRSGKEMGFDSNGFQDKLDHALEDLWQK